MKKNKTKNQKNNKNKNNSDDDFQWSEPITEEYNTWLIEISAEIKTSITEEEIKNVFNNFNSKEYSKIRVEALDFNRQLYGRWLIEFPVAIWQIKKHDEIERKFFENIKIETQDNITKISTSFKMGFPDFWNDSSIPEYVEGFERLTDILITSNNNTKENIQKELALIEMLKTSEIKKATKL